MNDLQILQLFFFVLCHRNYLRKTDNSIQRSTNLMTHICPKDRLHLVSFFRPPFSFDQLLRTTNPITDIVYQSKYLIPFKGGDTCLKIIRLPSTSSGYSISFNFPSCKHSRILHRNRSLTSGE